MNLETPLQPPHRRAFPSNDLSQIFANPAPSPYTPFSSHRASIRSTTHHPSRYSIPTFSEPPEPSEEIERYINGDLDTTLRGSAVDMLSAGRKRTQISDASINTLSLVSQVIDTLDAQIELSSELSSTHTARSDTRQRIKSVHTSLHLERSAWCLMQSSWHADTFQSSDLPTRRLALSGLDALAMAEQRGYLKLERIVKWLESSADEALTRSGGPQLKPLDDPAYRWGYTAAVMDGEPVSVDFPFQNGKLDEIERKAELRLSREVFRLVRAGRLDEAEHICRQIGQPWRAAAIAGGKRAAAVASNGKKGDARRLWRKAAISVARSKEVHFTTYERAVCGVLTGILDPVLAIAKSYEDQVWARASVLLDEFAEKSLGSKDSDITLHDQVILQAFDDSMNANDGTEDMDANLVNAFRRVQSYIALGPDLGEEHLLAFVLSLRELAAKGFANHSEWVCRFAAQVCVFLKYCGLIPEKSSDLLDNFDDTIQTYVKLVLEKDLQAEEQASKESAILSARPLVARLAAQFLTELSDQRKIISTFSDYLYSTLRADLEHEKVKTEQQGEESEEVEERRVVALKQATECLSDSLLQELMIHTVNLVWTTNIPAHRLDQDGHVNPEVEHVQDEITEEDELVVRSIEFLLYPAIANYDEAILRVTEAARRFFIVGKRGATRRLIKWFPHDVIPHVRPDYCSGALLEFDCWKAYIEALAAHSKWNAFYSSRKPTSPPEELIEIATASASDVDHNAKAAATRQLEEYKEDLAEFNRVCMKYAEDTVSSLRSALLFSGGWMTEMENKTDDKQMMETEQTQSRRSEEIKAVKEFGIPQMAMLLHHVLHESHLYEEAVKLASLIADEGLCLYKSFGSAELKSFLSQIAESSILLADEKCKEGHFTRPYKGSFFEELSN